jgi:putative copper export protein
VFSATLAASAPPTPSTARVLVETLYYLGLSAAAGVGLLSAYLAPAESEGGVVIRQALRLGIPVGVLVAVTAIAQFGSAAAKSAKTTLGNSLDPSVLASFVTAAPPRGRSLGTGQVALIQMGIYLLLVVTLFAMSRRASRAAAGAAIVLSVLAAVVPEVPFGALDANAIANSVLTSVHIAGVLAWVGGLTVLAVIGRLTRGSNLQGTERISEDWSTIWVRYSFVALSAVGMLVVSGSWLAWVHVGSPTQLWTTPYGRYLAVKLVLVLGMLIGGAYNTRVLLPRLRAAREADDRASLLTIAVEHFPKVVIAEAILAVAVLFVVPFFAGSARAEAGWASARSFDFTVFGTGVALIGLVVIGLWAGTRQPNPARVASGS